MGGYLISVSHRDALDHLEAFPLSLLEHELTSSGATHKEIPELLQRLSTILNRQHCYRRSVPLIDVVQMVKNLYGQFPEVEETTSIDLQSLEDEELHPLRQRVQHSVNEKILSTYLLKHKITREEAEKLSRAMHSIIVDWFEAGTSENSLFEYARTQFGITKTEYHAVWRTRVEYLARVAREAIKNYLEENL
jgi:predicted transcriptional regulator